MAETEKKKIPRASALSAEERARVIEMYSSGEYSFRDIAEEMDTNPTSVARICKDAGLEIRKPGPSPIARRNLVRNNKRRKEQAELRMAKEIAEARLRDRVDARADQLSLGEHLVASLVGEPRRDDDYTPEAVDRTAAEEEREEIRVSTWSPTPEELQAAQEAARRLHEGEEPWDGRLLGPVEAEPSAEGQTTAEMAAAYEDQIQSFMNSAEEMAAEHSLELARVREQSKLQWDSGVSYGYEQATNAVLGLIARMLEESPEKAEGEELIKLLERGEHWYLQHRSPKPWQNWETNRGQ